MAAAPTIRMTEMTLRTMQTTGLDAPIYSWQEGSVDDLGSDPDAFRRIYEREICGIRIVGALSRDEVETIRDRVIAIPETEFTDLPGGLRTLPMSFAQQAQLSEGSRAKLRSYHLEGLEYRETFPDRFGVDLESRIIDVVGRIAGGRTVGVPDGFEGGSLNTGLFRRLTPGCGVFKAHCGNYFHEEFPSFYDGLTRTLRVKDQLSYFVLIQKPDVGGQLTLFDVEWDRARTRLPGDTVLVDRDGHQLDLEDERAVRRQFIDPDPGDMILFSGGPIWHRVELVKGAAERITFGGFMALTHDDRGIRFWG